MKEAVHFYIENQVEKIYLEFIKSRGEIPLTDEYCREIGVHSEVSEDEFNELDDGIRHALEK